MIDLHTHILPNVDDGATSFDIALKMLEMEVENNVDTVVLTPHYFLSCYSKTNWTLVKSQFEKLKEKASHLPIKLLLGAELYYSQLLFEALKAKKIPTINKSKYLLIEFSLTDCYFNIEEVLYNIQCLGYIPILAHPERYPYLSIDAIMNIRNNGTLIQINTSSILGDFGRAIQRKVKKLLKLKCVDFISSDSHSLNLRQPNLKKTLELVEKKYKFNVRNTLKLFEDTINERTNK